jgi:peptidoglycan hydrolase-like protein with peptidoglycan-binding domain
MARQILNPSEPAAAEAPAAPVPDPRVRTLQALLKERGLYTGTVDGLTGPMTAEAIRTFERQMNLAATGEVSERLIGLAQRNRVAAQSPAQAPVQSAARPPVQAPAQPRVGGVPVQNAAYQPVAEPRTVASIPATPRPQPAPARPAAAPPTDLRTAPSAEERTMRVQRALAAIGLNPGKADGRMRPETQEAIKRFEIDRGLKVSGQVSDRLMFELIASGAMR